MTKEERIKRLESLLDKAGIGREEYEYVGDPENDYQIREGYYYISRPPINFHTTIRQILKHLGLKIEYVSEQLAYTKLVPIKKGGKK